MKGETNRGLDRKSEIIRGLGRNGGLPEGRTREALEGRRLPREMYNFYNMDQYQTSPHNLYNMDQYEISPHNLYNMDQYETSSLEEARHKDFDIWLQDFDEQVSKF